MGTPPPPRGQTDTYENITFPQLRLRTVYIFRQNRILTMEYSGILRRISSMLWYMSVPLFAWKDNIRRTSSILPWSKNLYICNATVYYVYYHPFLQKPPQFYEIFEFLCYIFISNNSFFLLSHFSLTAIFR